MHSRTHQLERHRRADLKLVDAVELLRAFDLVAPRAPDKAACPAEVLAFAQKCLTAPQLLLSPLAFGDISHRADELDLAGIVDRAVADAVYVSDRPSRKKEPELGLEIAVVSDSCCPDLADSGAILRMNALEQHRIRRRDLFRIELEDRERLL